MRFKNILIEKSLNEGEDKENLNVCGTNIELK